MWYKNAKKIVVGLVVFALCVFRVDGAASAVTSQNIWFKTYNKLFRDLVTLGKQIGTSFYKGSEAVSQGLTHSDRERYEQLKNALKEGYRATYGELQNFKIAIQQEKKGKAAIVKNIENRLIRLKQLFGQFLIVFPKEISQNVLRVTLPIEQETVLSEELQWPVASQEIEELDFTPAESESILTGSSSYMPESIAVINDEQEIPLLPENERSLSGDDISFFYPESIVDSGASDSAFIQDEDRESIEPAISQVNSAVIADAIPQEFAFKPEEEPQQIIPSLSMADYADAAVSQKPIEAEDRTAIKRLFLTNNTGYTIKISYVTPKQESSDAGTTDLVQKNLVVADKQEVDLGPVEAIWGDISYQMYGKWRGTFARIYTIPIDDIKNKIIEQKLNGTTYNMLLTGFGQDVKLQAYVMRHQTRAHTLEELFPRVNQALNSSAWRLQGWRTFDQFVKLLPHFLLNIEPNATQEEINSASDARVFEFEHQVKDRALKKAAINALEDARKYMLEKYYGSDAYMFRYPNPIAMHNLTGDRLTIVYAVQEPVGIIKYQSFWLEPDVTGENLKKIKRLAYKANRLMGDLVIVPEALGNSEMRDEDIFFTPGLQKIKKNELIPYDRELGDEDEIEIILQPRGWFALNKDIPVKIGIKKGHAETVR